MGFFDKFVEYCKNDENVRALALQGSRVYSENKIDKYSDYDVILIVRNICEYTKSDEWVKQFGNILIMQKPTDWYKEPYDYSSTMPYTYLVQYDDGNRLDINLYDINNLNELLCDIEPRVILFKKDHFILFDSISPHEFKYVKKPNKHEFNDTVNEFYWISLYVAKGIKRNELIYTREMYEHYFMAMLYKMIAFYIGTETDFKVTVGKSYKYLKDFLTEFEMNELASLLPSGDLVDIREKLIKSFDIFDKYARKVSAKLEFDLEDYNQIKSYIENNF